MSGTFCKVEMIGNLGRDPEMRVTPTNAQPVTTMSVAATRSYNRGEEKVEETIWVRVTTWGKLAELCNQYLKKGSKVYVEGRLTPDAHGNPRIWQKQDGTPGASFEVTAEKVVFLSSNGSGNGAAAEHEEAGEEIPF